MKTIQTTDIKKQTKQMRKNNPDLSQNQEKLSEWVLEGKLDDLQIAYFTEVMDEKNHSIHDIQILQDDITSTLNSSKKIVQVEFDCQVSNIQKKEIQISNNEMEYRKKLAKLFGISDKIKPNYYSIRKLAGIAKHISNEKLDATELVKLSRDNYD